MWWDSEEAIWNVRKNGRKEKTSGLRWDLRECTWVFDGSTEYVLWGMRGPLGRESVCK